MLVILFAPSGGWAKPSKEFDQHVAAAEDYYKAEKYDQAIVELQAAYQLDPAAWLLINIGRSHFRANRYTESLDAFNQALKGKLTADEQKEVLASISSVLSKREKQREEERKAAEKQRAADQAQMAALTSSVPNPKPVDKPLYKKGWFWGTITGVAAGVALAVGLGVGLGTRSTPSPGPVDVVPPLPQ